MPTTTATPASPRQEAYLASLVRERDIELPDGPLSMDQASRLIDAALKAPRRQSAPLAQPGYYLDGDQPYVVVKTRDGQRTYAKKLVIRPNRTATWVYSPGSVADLAKLPPLTVEQAARLGHLHGICVVCATPLTDPKSVQRGIGPVCAKRLGIPTTAPKPEPVQQPTLLDPPAKTAAPRLLWEGDPDDPHAGDAYTVVWQTRACHPGWTVEDIDNYLQVETVYASPGVDVIRDWVSAMYDEEQAA